MQEAIDNNQYCSGLDGKESTCQCRRPEFDPWVGKIPWRRAWQPTSIFLPGESPWTEELGRLQSMGSHKVRYYWATKHSTALRTTYKFFLRDGAHTRNLIWESVCQMGSGLGVCQICSPGKTSAVFPPIQSPFPIFQFQAKFYPPCKWPWNLSNHPHIIFSFPFLIKPLQLMAIALPQTFIKFSLFCCHKRILSQLHLSSFPGQSFWNTFRLW